MACNLPAASKQISRLSKRSRNNIRVSDGLLSAFDVTMRWRKALRTPEGLVDPPIETPVGWIPARQTPIFGDRRAKSNPAGKTDGAVVVLAEVEANAHRTNVSAASAGDRGHALPEGFFTSLEGTFRDQEEASRT